MTIVIQVLVILSVLLFTLALLGEKNEESKQQYIAVLIATTISLAFITVFGVSL